MTRAEEIARAAKDPDWGQVVANGGPPCFHVTDGRFCLRAERWPGHGIMHPYVDLAAALEDFGRERERYTTVYLASEYHEDLSDVLWWHFPVCEPPMIGNPCTEIPPDGFKGIARLIDEGWITHFSRIPVVFDGGGTPLKIGSRFAARIREGK